MTTREARRLKPVYKPGARLAELEGWAPMPIPVLTGGRRVRIILSDGSAGGRCHGVAAVAQRGADGRLKALDCRVYLYS